MKKAGLIFLILCVALLTSSVPLAETGYRVDWQGQGSENSFLNEGYTGWHWVLTSGGNTQILEGTIFTTIEDSKGEIRTVSSTMYRPGQGEEEQCILMYSVKRVVRF